MLALFVLSLLAASLPGINAVLKNVTVDDTDTRTITYLGAWESYNSGLDFGGSHRLSSDAAANATFEFVGTSTSAAHLICQAKPVWGLDRHGCLLCVAAVAIHGDFADKHRRGRGRFGEPDRSERFADPDRRIGVRDVFRRVVGDQLGEQVAQDSGNLRKLYRGRWLSVRFHPYIIPEGGR